MRQAGGSASGPGCVNHGRAALDAGVQVLSEEVRRAKLTEYILRNAISEISNDKSLAPYRECRGVESPGNGGTFEPRHFR